MIVDVKALIHNYMSKGYSLPKAIKKARTQIQNQKGVLEKSKTSHNSESLFKLKRK